MPGMTHHESANTKAGLHSVERVLRSFVWLSRHFSMATKVPKPLLSIFLPVTDGLPFADQHRAWCLRLRAPGSLLEMPPLNSSLYFDKIPRWFLCTLRFKDLP